MKRARILRAFLEKISPSWRITLIYGIVGLIWIIFSDTLLLLLIKDAHLITLAQTYKGWFYVVITSILVYELVRKYQKRMQQSYDEIVTVNHQLAEEITDHKKAQLALEDALEEKEVMLQEIFHRVYNNLQLVSSVIKLQKHYTQDEETKIVLAEIYQRIINFAHVHKKIYSSIHLNRIPIKPYLRTLLTHVLNSEKETPLYIEPLLLVDKDISLNVKSAIPISLILCEILVELGREQGSAGNPVKPEVTLVKEAGFHRLTVTCSESRIPNDWHDENRSMSHSIITALCDQLQGSIGDSEQDGLHFQMSFHDIIGA